LDESWGSRWSRDCPIHQNARLRCVRPTGRIHPPRSGAWRANPPSCARLESGIERRAIEVGLGRPARAAPPRTPFGRSARAHRSSRKSQARAARLPATCPPCRGCRSRPGGRLPAHVAPASCTMDARAAGGHGAQPGRDPAAAQGLPLGRGVHRRLDRVERVPGWFTLWRHRESLERTLGPRIAPGGPRLHPRESRCVTRPLAPGNPAHLHRVRTDEAVHSRVKRTQDARENHPGVAAAQPINRARRGTEETGRKAGWSSCGERPSCSSSLV
jgi:hypothetical protein